MGVKESLTLRLALNVYTTTKFLFMVISYGWQQHTNKKNQNKLFAEEKEHRKRTIKTHSCVKFNNGFKLLLFFVVVTLYFYSLLRKQICFPINTSKKNPQPFSGKAGEGK